MNHETYKQESKRTLSGDFHTDKVNPMDAIRHLGYLAEFSKELDNDKKGLFYGRDPIKTNIPSPFSRKNPSTFETNELHMLLGMATELGELIEVIFDAWENPKESDQARVADELGDLHWYEAGLYRERCLNQANVLSANIAKLKARFPEKFSSDQALNRNIAAEESALQSALG